MFKIEKNISIDDFKSRRVPEKYPFSRMSIGDSFSFPISMRDKIDGAARKSGKLNNTAFSIRTVSDEECRIWRVS